MEITEIRITLCEEKNRLRAFANIVFDNCFIVRGLKIIEGDDGYFVAMPSTPRDRNGRSRDIAHPLNNDMRKIIEKAVLEAYEEELGSQEQAEDPIEYGR